MADESRNNDGARRAAAQSESLLNARNAARRGSQGAAGSERTQARHARHSASDSPRSDYRRRRGGEGRDSEPSRSGNKVSTVDFIKRNSTYIISVVGVVLIVVLMIIFIHACTPQEKPTDPQEPVYESPYDWSRLDTTNGRFAYVVDGKVKSKLGVDVSENQQWIDWKAVKADGIDFAMIRLGYRGATEGELYVDDYFAYNLEQAREAGLDCGVYFFSQAVTADEAREEAKFVLEQLNGAKLQCPVAFDAEIVTQIADARTADLTDKDLSLIADAFCDTIEAAGYTTLVYGNASDLRSYDVDALTGRGIWWAEYGVKIPAHYTDIVMWQYDNGGQVDGIAAAVDMNIDLTHALD